MEDFRFALFPVPVFSLPCSRLLREQLSISPCIARSLPPSMTHQEMRSCGRSRKANVREPQASVVGNVQKQRRL